MTRVRLGDALAGFVAAVAVLNTLAALSMPVPERRSELVFVLVALVVLLLHAVVYRLGDRMRERFGLAVYAAAQAVLVFGFALLSPPAPVTLVVFVGGTAELVTLARDKWGAARITIGAIALFVLAALLTSDLYRAATAGVILASTGLVAYAVAAVLGQRRSARDVAAPSTNSGHLSAREVEVLRELVRGARNSEIAEKLGISDRTVKAHLGSVYQKLGVQSRAAAVALALQQKLV